MTEQVDEYQAAAPQSMGFRRELLQAASEDELLKQQSEFLTKNSIPSARVTRVKKKQPEKAPVSEAADLSEVLDDEHGGGLPIFHDVVERVRDESTVPPCAPSPAGLPGRAFPEAVHRKVSKFALGRKTRSPSVAPSTASAPAPQPPMPERDIIPLVQEAIPTNVEPTPNGTNPASPPGRDVISPVPRPAGGAVTAGVSPAGGTVSSMRSRAPGDSAPRGGAALTAAVVSGSGGAGMKSLTAGKNASDPFQGMTVPPALKGLKTSTPGHVTGHSSPVDPATMDGSAKAKKRVSFSNDGPRWYGATGGLDDGDPGSNKGANNRSGGSNKEAVSGGPGIGNGGGNGDDAQMAGIDRQNRQQLAAMSEEERSEALAEVRDRIPAGVLAWLKRRGAKRLQQGGPSGTSSQAAAATAASTAGGQLQTQATAAPQAAQPSLPKAVKRSSEAVSSKKDLFDFDDTGGEGAAGGRSLLDIRLVARVRFGFDGGVVGLQREGELPVEEQVVMRDSLRQDEGVVAAEGYTGLELMMLARSSVSSQRAAALKLIAWVLSHAKPSVQDLDDAGNIQPRPLPRPSNLVDSFQLDWSDVWKYFVGELGVATTIRLAMDDTVSTVVAAASEALLCLVGPGAAEEILQEVAETMPLPGWPKVRVAQLKRAHASGLWECPLDLSVKLMADLESGRAAAPHAPWAEQDQSPEELAGSDPLAGLLQMGLLPRIRLIVQNQTAPAALPSLLCVLAHLAAASAAAAEAIARSPGMLEGVAKIAESYPAGSDTNSASTQKSRLCALRLTRALCQSSRLAGQLARTAGLLQHPRRILMLTDMEEGNMEQLLLKLEAIRTWRAATACGVPLMHMDDMYPCIARLLLPPPSDSVLDDEVEGARKLQQIRYEAVQWLVAAEGHLLLEALLTHAACVDAGSKDFGGEMLSSGGAAAMVSEACDLLTVHSVRRVASLASCSAAHLLSAHTTYRGTIPLLHPALVVPVAAAALCCLSAVMRLLGTYWATYIPQLSPPQMCPASELDPHFVELACTNIHPIPHLMHGPQQNGTTASLPPKVAPGSKPDSKPDSAAADSASNSAPDSALNSPPNTALDSAPDSAPNSASDSAPDSMPDSAVKSVAGSALDSALDVRQDGAARGGADVGASLLCWLLGLASGVAAQTPPWSTLPGAAILVAQVTGAGALQSALLLLDTLQPASELLAGLLAPVIQHVRLPAATKRSSCIKSAEPWILAHMQAQQPRLALLSTALQLLKSRWPEDSKQSIAEGFTSREDSTVSAGNSKQGAPEVLAGAGRITGTAKLAALCLDAVAGVIATAPPGYEESCLEVLASGLSAPLLRPLLTVADGALTQFNGWPSVLRSAASGVLRGTHGSDHDGRPAEVMFPRPPMAATEVIARFLFHSYAASWLSLLSVDDASANKTPSTTSDPTKPRPQPRLSPAYTIASAAGSRLPAPPYWMLTEAHALPQHVAALLRAQQAPSNEDGSERDGVNIVAAALLLCLGMEACGSMHLFQIPRGLKLQCLLQLTYVFDVWELLPTDVRPSTYTTWTDPDVRWPLAALTHLMLHGSLPNPQACTSTSAAPPLRLAVQPTTESAPQTAVLEPEQPAALVQSAVQPGIQLTIQPAVQRSKMTVQPPMEKQVQQEAQHTIPLAVHQAAQPAVQPAVQQTVQPALPPGVHQAAEQPAVHQAVQESAQQAAQQAVQQAVQHAVQPPILLSPNWSSSSLAEQLCDIFISSSMLDPLFGAHVALLLLPGAQSSRSARTTWNHLASEGVLHLLPRLEDCPGRKAAFSEEFKDEEMQGILIHTTSNGDLDKSAELHALPAYLATRSIAASVLAGAAAPARVDMLRAESHLRSVLRGASHEWLSQLFVELKARYLGTADQSLRSFVNKAVAADPPLLRKAQDLLRTVGY